MKVAIIGAVDPTVTYRDWEVLFRRNFRNNQLSEICITGGETLLNEYAKTYAGKFSIPVSTYNLAGNDAEARLSRNRALIEDSDLLVAFTSGNNEQSVTDEIAVSLEHGKKALIVNADEQPHRYHPDELISIEEEMALVKKIRQSDDDCEEAKERLTVCYRRFVKLKAQKYMSAEHPLDKLIAEGNIGLIHAARKYDPARGFRFLPYAICWIELSIKEAVSRN